MTTEFYALRDSKNIPLDKKLDALFEHKQNGFFIELGAFDGITQSNTYFFELNRGWNGILIEPSKTSFETSDRDKVINTERKD